LSLTVCLKYRSRASVAAECTNFIGPAGYGFVQGIFRFRHCDETASRLLQSARPRSTSPGTFELAVSCA
jgi:hypothetical protein